MIENITSEICCAADCVLFDFDGTLCDSQGDILSTLAQTVESFGFEQPDPKNVKIGPPLDVMIHQAVGTDVDQEVIESMVLHYRQIYETSEYNQSPLYPGALELLKRLKNWGIYLAIATNKRELSTHRILTRKKILPFFDFVMTSDGHGEKWSKERMLQHVLDATGVKPEKSLFFGDTVGDVMAGKTVGLVAVAALYGYGDRRELLELQPEYICERLSELVD